MRVSHYLVEYLKKMGVRAVFGVGGANIEDIYDALSHAGDGMKVVLAKHEFSAGTMADSYSRMTGQIGIVISTSGGGAFNLIPALAESFASQVPVLAIIGQIPTGREGQGGFQDSSGLSGSIDAEKVFQGTSKYCKRITSPEMIQEAIEEATTAALRDPQGPVVLLIPKNVQQSELPNELSWPTPTLALDQSLPKQSEIENAALLLRKSKTGVVLVCGDGVYRTKSEASVVRLAELLDASVAVTADGKASFDNYSPYYIGLVGVMGHSPVLSHLEVADTCVIIGTRLGDIDRMGLEPILTKKNIVYIHSAEPFFTAGHEQVTLTGSVKAILELLLVKIEHQNPGSSVSPRLDQSFLKCLTSAFSKSEPKKSAASQATTEEFLKSLEIMIEPRSNILVDAGNIGAFAVHFLRIRKSCSFNIALGMGGMGYTFGAAIGAAIANQRKTYVIAGDGSFFMHGSEIHTAIELQLPITYLIFNNNAHGMCLTREALYFNADYSFNRFKRSHLASGMSSMFPTLTSFSITEPDELKTCLNKTKDHPSPVFFSIEMDPEELPPFLPFVQQKNSLTVNHEAQTCHNL